MFRKVDPKQSLPKLEEEILLFWDEKKIFEKSITNREGKPTYSFYDGPPFATGTPHYGHIVASAIKDTVPRYWTMRGYQVERKWGWDCHGLPIENIAEKELGFTHKKEILEYGIEKFNELCRSKVLEYVEEWKKVINRFGRWADMEHAYRTMDRDFMESVWRVFKELWDKGLVYESYRTMHICPRCETTLSQSEVAEGYKDVKDLAVVAKFELVDEPGTFVLAWTTTPWTLPGNVALAVNPKITYVKALSDGAKYIVAKDLVKKVFVGKDFMVEEEMKGSQLVGKAYKPLFDYYAKEKSLQKHESGWKIYPVDFVTTDMGTGIAHEAPAFGEEDMELSKQVGLPWIQHVNMDGTMKTEVTDFSGKQVKPKEDPQAMDVEIIKYLAHKGLLFSKEKYEHSYPHCWRCDTPLLNYATSSWFVAVTKIKPKMLELAKNIRWSPEHMKEGRFGKWLEGARDWSVSRQRFWASVMPIWKCDACEHLQVFGAVADLEKASGQKVEDLHKHVVDKVTYACEKCEKGIMKRIPDVLDTWFDSGSMPYGEFHYPFENKENFEKSFPAEFIAEGVDQTRAWFYYLHVIAAAIKDSNAFKNVIVNGIVLAEDGKKMSKKLKNYPDPMEVIDKHGADALRLYLLSSPVVSAENLNFSEKELSDLSRNMYRMLWNSYSFFVMYASIDNWKPEKDSKPTDNLLDRWILSELQVLIREVNASMETYELARATRQFMPFVDNLSNWYIRRSRKRFWKSENDGDKQQAYQTLYTVLVELSKALAPFMPFLAEEIYRNLTEEESVHLADYPKADAELIDENLNQEMAHARLIVTMGLKFRADAKFKVRQPLQYVGALAINDDLKGMVMDELNVKEYRVRDDLNDQVELDLNPSPELKLEGEAREIIRAIQEGRKKAGFEVSDRIILGYSGKENVFQKWNDLIAKEVLATEVKTGEIDGADYSETIKLEGEDFRLSLKRNA